MARIVEKITLAQEAESSLKDLLKKGKLSSRTFARIHILLKSHEGKHPKVIVEELSTSPSRVYTVLQLYRESGWERAIYDAPRSGAPIKIDGISRAKITALACTDAPQGHSTWTLQLLANKAVELNFVEEISYGTVHNILKKTK
jgi:putative transposase